MSATTDSVTVHIGSTVIHMGIYGEHLTNAVREQLQAERGVKGWSYRQLADRAGMTEQTVMRRLTGKREIPVNDLGDMAHALGISPESLLMRAVERIPK